jgi:hydroxymethylbilane synthase
MTILRVGTRGSQLARTQTETVAAALREAGFRLEIVIVRTAGDKDTQARFKDLGPDIFTRALDDALAEGTIDCAVHSAKDVPTELPAHVTVCAFPARAAPEDVLVCFGGAQRLEDIPAGGRIGTSSLRRRALLLNQRPDLDVVELRGNVRTRLETAGERGLAATVLARAGLQRLELAPRAGQILDPHRFIPQAGQGALAVTCAAKGSLASELEEILNHRETRVAVGAERGFLSRLGGGCQVPAGAYAEAAGGAVELRAVLLTADGRTCLRVTRSAAAAEAEAAGRDAAGELLGKGGEAIIRALRGGGGP